MFRKKKEVQKPTVYSTSSTTRTENTITTANGSIRTTTVVKSSYQETRSSSNIGASNFTRFSSDRLSLPKLRSAFDEPTHNYGVRQSLPKPLSVSSGLTKAGGKSPIPFDAKPFALPASTRVPQPYQTPLRNQVPVKKPDIFNNAPSHVPQPYQTPLQNQIKKPDIFNNELNTQLNVRVKATGQFYDTNSKVPTYQTRSPKKRGRLLLINNIEFKGKRRDGADVDHRNIVVLFKQIGFEIVEHKNKKKDEIMKIVKNFATGTSLKNCDICITVIMSHGTTYGEQTMIETIDEQILETEWVVQQFDGVNCKSMNGKPKIFIFQCCRGENEHANVQTDAAMFLKPRQVQDILISYSTIPGFVAYRDPKLGSWYIQGLCKVFMEHAHDTHIEDLLKIVDEELAKLNVGSQRQTSSYENRGFKRCYLHPIRNYL